MDEAVVDVSFGLVGAAEMTDGVVVVVADAVLSDSVCCSVAAFCGGIDGDFVPRVESGAIARVVRKEWKE